MPVLNLLDSSLSTTITSGQALSPALQIGDGLAVVGLIGPSGWTAAAVSFDVSYDGVSYFPLFNDTGEVNLSSSWMNTAQSRFFALDPTNWIGINYLKIRSGLKGSEVIQLAGRVFSLVTRPI